MTVIKYSIGNREWTFEIIIAAIDCNTGLLRRK